MMQANVINTSSELPATELLHLGFRRFLPHPILRPWVQCYWSIQQCQLPDEQSELLYPDGGASLNFDFVDGNSRFSTVQALQSLSFQGHVDNFGVRFNPGGAFSLLHLPVAELTQPCYPCDELNLSGLGALFYRLSKANVSRRVAMMDGWLLQQAACCDIVQPVLPKLIESSGRLDQLLQQISIGRRRFERQFKQTVGLAPNELKMLLRVKKARELIKRQPDLPLTQIAQLCDYYDQAHFIRQFSKVVTTTPGRYRQRQLRRLARGELQS